MFRGVNSSIGRALIAGALSIAAVVAVAGTASAAPQEGVYEPVAVVQQVEAVSAGLPLEEVATDPAAQNSDPMVNGAAAGALAGAVGSGVLAAAPCLFGAVVAAIPCAIIGAVNGALWGTAIGLLVGAVAPGAVPQILP